MPSEIDPLLPQGDSAPEIRGYGFSKPSTNGVGVFDDVPHDDHEVWDEAEPFSLDALEDENSRAEFEGGPSSIRRFAGHFIVVVAVAFVIVISIPGALDLIWQLPDWSSPWTPKPSSSISERVSKILTSTPLIDGHDDLAITIRAAYRNQIYGKNFTSAFELGGMVSQVDLPRLKAGRVGGSFWSAFTPCLANGTNFDDTTISARSVTTTLSQIDLMTRLLAKYSTIFASPLLTKGSALIAFRESQQLISPIGIEGLHQIGHSLSNLRLYHALGVKYASLTHNCYNHYADPALVQDPMDWKSVKPAKPYWNGLSPEGIIAIREMNRIGLLVDLSHVSKETMLDVLGGNSSKFAGSRAPVMFSHSSAYALCPHPRNVPDDVLKLVQKTRSVVMVNVAPDFISCVRKDDGKGLPDFFERNNTVEQVARHIIYVGNFIGFDYVGIGSDFDGIPTGPIGLEDVGLFPDLIAELLRRGVSDADAAKVVGQNVLRVWEEAENVALRMREEGFLPAEDEIHELG